MRILIIFNIFVENKNCLGRIEDLISTRKENEPGEVWDPNQDNPWTWTMDPGVRSRHCSLQTQAESNPNNVSALHWSYVLRYGLNFLWCQNINELVTWILENYLQGCIMFQSLPPPFDFLYPYLLLFLLFLVSCRLLFSFYFVLKHKPPLVITFGIRRCI